MNRANTLCIWCMFAQVFPLFQETYHTGQQWFQWATVSTQYVGGAEGISQITAGTSVGANPNAMIVMSALALLVNAVALGFIVYRSAKTKTNPYTGEIFTFQKYYKDAASRAVIE